MPRNRPSRQQKVQTSSVPAPIGGLNARDSIAAMPPTDALVMVNWFPTPSGIDVRGGSVDWATGITGVVETVMAYNGLTSSNLFAIANGTVYDVTATGVAVNTGVTGQQSSRYSFTNFGTAGGNFLVAANGFDSILLYNGTNWQYLNSGFGATVSSITNVGTTATLTTASNHFLFTGNVVTIIGATPAAYNGTYTITVTAPNKFTYTMATTPGSSASPAGSYTVTPSLQGIGPTLLSYVTAFKGRLYFIQKNTLKVWYLPVAQIGGLAQLFDMSSVFKLGGQLVAMQSWNVDTVQGPNDYFAFFSNKGEVVVYQGYDPSQSATWSLVGNFRIGRPASGFRFVTKVGSDLYCATVDGVIPLSKAMLTDRSQGSFQVSNKIDNLLDGDVVNYSNNYGWQIFLFPVTNKIIVNVPQVENVTQYQYVCNTLTGAWTVFSGWNASCFEMLGDSLYYGTNGKVVKADTGTSDNNVAIITDLKPAFSSFGAPGQNKQFTMARPIFSTDGSVGISAILNIDFRDSQPTEILSLPSVGALSLWNVSPWNTSFWSVFGQVNINWQSVAGVGFQASYRMKTISKTAVSLLAIDYGYQVGGIY